MCIRCPLHQTRALAVPGEGHPDTEVVFVGEGPGYNEDQQGRPFVGAAGSLLNELLRAIGWKRPDVFITNVVKCRPPGNRDPEPSEIDACAPYLKRQLEVLDPAVIVTLGRHSLGHFTPGARIGATHGTARPVDPATGAPNAVTYAMYHPAAALRQGSLRQTMLADMANLPEVLIDARDRRATVSTETATTASPAAEAYREPVPPRVAHPAPVPDDAPDDAVAIAIAPELVAVSVNELAADEAPPVDHNQMSLF